MILMDLQNNNPQRNGVLYDDYSRYGHVYLHKHKYEAIARFKAYKIKVETQLGRPIKDLNSDREGEFEILNSFYKLNSVRHIYSMLYKSKQNDIE